MALVAGGLHAWLLAATTGEGGYVRLTLPVEVGEWRNVEVLPLQASSADGDAQARYRRGGNTVDLGIAYFRRQRQGHKIGDVAADLAGQGYWRVDGEEAGEALIGSLPIPVRAVHLSHNDRHRLVWFFVWIGGRHAAAVLGGDARSALVTLSVPDDDAARAALIDFCSKAMFLDPALSGAIPVTH
jgi:EpsI family protein